MIGLWVGWLVGWLGWLVGWLVGLVGWLVGWLACRTAVSPDDCWIFVFAKETC